MSFQKATKKKTKLRLALCGVTGSGKTYSALEIAKHLGTHFAVIDTERGSASKYAGEVADFDVVELESFSPARYIAMLKEAAKAGYPVVVVDSLSHAWMGEGGILDQKDKKSGNDSFGAWRTLTPQHNELVEAILSYPGHVIATMRSKTEYVLEKNAQGKNVPRKVGMAPVQRDGLEYEFDVVGDMDFDHCLHVTKSRCVALADQSIRKPGEQVARTLLAWLEQGDDVVEAPPPPPERLSDKWSEMQKRSVSLANSIIYDFTTADELAYAAGQIPEMADDSPKGKLIAKALDLLISEKSGSKDTLSEDDAKLLRALKGYVETYRKER